MRSLLGVQSHFSFHWGTASPTAWFALAEELGFGTHRLLRAVGAATTLDRIPDPAVDGGERVKHRTPILAGSPDAWARTPADYADAFAVYAAAIRRADRMAERLARFAPSRATLHPPLPPSDAATGADGSTETALATLRRLAYEGAAIRYGAVGAAVRRRLEHELGLIECKGFAEYFLVVHDIVKRLVGGDGRIRRGRSITCGRGSGAASLVNYCLGVTNVDALKHNLMFERFLNDARLDPPDNHNRKERSPQFPSPRFLPDFLPENRDKYGKRDTNGITIFRNWRSQLLEYWWRMMWT